MSWNSTLFNSRVSTWDNIFGGVKEEVNIYRKIEGENFEHVATCFGDSINNTWIDTTLDPQKVSGRCVMYYTKTQVVTYDELGNRIGDVIAEKQSDLTIQLMPGEVVPKKTLDVNGDGKVDVADINDIVDYILGK